MQKRKAHMISEIRESVLPHFFKPCLIIMHHSIQYHLSLGRYFKNNKYVIAKVRCFLVKWWCSSNKLKVLLLDLSFPFLLISLNLKSIKISMFKYFVFIRILILLFFKDFLVYLPLFKFCRESYNKRIFSLSFLRFLSAILCVNFIFLFIANFIFLFILFLLRLIYSFFGLCTYQRLITFNYWVCFCE